MFKAMISWWRHWRFRKKIGDMERTLKALRKIHQDEDELVRLMAAVTIMRLDPTNSEELMPHILAARGSENQVVNDLAEEFMTAK